MKNLRNIALAILFALLATIGLAAPAQAARAAAPLATITLDANATGLDLGPTAADLSKNTGISVVAGSCDGGLYCVEFSKDECTSGSAAGCAWGSDVGTCFVSIEPVAYDFDYWFTVFVSTHEATHCLTWIGGAGFFHVDDRPSILNSATSLRTMRESQTKINAADRKMISSIFAGTY